MTKLAMTVMAMSTMMGVAAADSAKPAAEAPKMDMTPPKALTDLAKQMAGTWKCKGQGMGSEMKMVDMTATLMSKSEMDGSWIHDSFDAKMGKDAFHYESYVTIDRKSNKFHRMEAEAGGGWSAGDSRGMTGGKMDWEMSAHDVTVDVMLRDHLDTTDKAGVKKTGEMSTDGGKSWMKIYEMVCKK